MTDPVKKLYTNLEKIPFLNPRVFKIELDNRSTYSDFLSIRKILYKNIAGSYGYSNIFEEHHSGNDSVFTAQASNTPQIINIMPLFGLYKKVIYVFFENDEDCLQFKLSINRQIQQVAMWPSSLKFTVQVFDYDHSGFL